MATNNHIDQTGLPDTCYDNEESPLLGSTRSTSSKERSISAPKIPGCISARHVLTILCFCGLLNVYAMRVNLSIALEAMVNDMPSTNYTPVVGVQCPGALNSTEPAHKSSAKTFDWDEETQNQILGAFFYGYIMTQIPGGILAAKFGGKWLFGLGVLCTSVFTIVTPFAAEAGDGWLIAARVLEGIGEGVTYPTFYALLSKWAPPLERTILLSVITSGAAFGTIVATPIAGVLCDSDFLGGWPSVFYLSGACGLVWFIFWVFFAFDSPAQHPRISREEKEYIERAIGHVEKTSSHLPVFSIMTSIPVWGVFIANFTSTWLFYTLLTNLPNYLENILKFDISQSGFLVALPYAFTLITTIVSGLLADYLRKHGYLTTRQTRNVFNGLGALIPGLGIAMVGYVGCDKVLAMVFLCISYAAQGLLTAGYATNILDIASGYASLVQGIANTFGTIPGFVGPYVVGLLTEGNNTMEQWQIVFWICAGMQFLGFILYLLMSSGEEQSWARDDGPRNLLVNDSDYDTSLYNDDHSINPDMAHTWSSSNLESKSKL